MKTYLVQLIAMDIMSTFPLMDLQITMFQNLHKYNNLESLYKGAQDVLTW